MDEKSDSERKSRNLSEKKRRDEFNLLISELCSMVLPDKKKMEKSIVLKSTISFLRNHQDFCSQQNNVQVQDNWKPSLLSNEEFIHLMLEAFDGFVVAFLPNGKLLYTSENMVPLLGYSTKNLSLSLFDLIHESDHSSLYKVITTLPAESATSKGFIFSICVHMKRGPSSSRSNCTYEVVNLNGTFQHLPSGSLEGSSVDCDSNSCSSSICSPASSATCDWSFCLVALARLRTPKLQRVFNFTAESRYEFTSRHSLEWTFLFLDHKASPVIGYSPFEILGTSGYDYYHVDDIEDVALGHEMLLQAGEGTSNFYRFLTKGQQWIWLQTRYFISYHQWNSKPEFVVCTNIVLSDDFVQNAMKNGRKKCDILFKKSSNIAESSCQSPVHTLHNFSSEISEHSVAGSSRSSRLNVVLPSQNCAVSEERRVPMTSPLAMSKQSFSQRHETLQKSTSTADLQTAFPCTFGIPEPSNTYSNSIMNMQVASCSQLQLNYLQRRHQLLQHQIFIQQEELKKLSKQLVMAQGFEHALNDTYSNVPSSQQESNLTAHHITRPHDHRQIVDQQNKYSSSANHHYRIYIPEKQQKMF